MNKSDTEKHPTVIILSAKQAKAIQTLQTHHMKNISFTVSVSEIKHYYFNTNFSIFHNQANKVLKEWLSIYTVLITSTYKTIRY